METPKSGSPHPRKLSTDSPFGTPLGGSVGPGTPGPAGLDISNSAAEEFFYKRHPIKKPNASDTLTDNLQEKLGLQLIQPKPRVVLQPNSSVVDLKKRSEEVGLPPSLKVNRSSTNLANSSSTSAVNLLSMGSGTSGVAPPPNRARSLLSKSSKPMFNLHNLSTGSLTEVLSEDEESDHVANNSSGKLQVKLPTSQSELTEAFQEIDADDWSHQFNDMVHGRAATKLAPFGGFSNPGIESDLLSCQNIFDTAPWKVTFTDQGNGSLTKAVKLATEQGIIENRKWVGTLSMPSDYVSSKVIDDIAHTLSADYNSDAIFPNDDTFQGHYKSYCKQILWPTLHYQIPDDPKSKAFEAHSWDQYKLLNQMMADKAVEVYLRENGDSSFDDPNNIIWVHDYHLMLVPNMIRKKLPNVKIGFFLHVSFPSSEVFRVFAFRKELLEGMLGANCISFQTDEYVRHFLQTCSRLLLADTNEMGISYEGRFILANTIPVGIDAPSVKKQLTTDVVQEWRLLIRERWGDQRLLVSRDKLDKLRGIKPKLLAYEKLLKKHPEYVDNTVLIQICIGSSQDPDYEAEIMKIVARINSLPENISISQPVIFLQQDIEFEQYLALQCEADVFVVSSMREGLNLTCHEFIVATSEKKSPLVLSEFTGSSPLLECNGKGALLINPWDLRGLTDSFEKLLNMSKEEKELRWKNCYQIVLDQDSNNWITKCLQSIREAWSYDQRKSRNNIEMFTKAVLDKFYNQPTNSGKRLIFLNLETPLAISAIYDTSSSSGKTPAAGKTDSFSEPSRIANLLSDLLLDPLNHVYLITFLKRADLDILYRTSANLGLIAENGGYIKLIGSKSWVSIVDEKETLSWMPQVTKLIASKVERLPGSHIEVEDCTIRFHPGRAFLEDHNRSMDVMGDCIQHINEVFSEKDGVHATLIRNVVIVQQNQLTLKALKFVLSYYTQVEKGIQSHDLIEDFQVKKISSSQPMSKISLEDLKLSDTDKLDKAVTSLLIAGGSTLIDEPGFEYAKELKQSGEIENVLTVAVLGSEAELRTSAAYGVAGKNELLGLLAKVKS